MPTTFKSFILELKTTLLTGHFRPINLMIF